MPSFVLDALEQALHDRRPVHRGGLVHHSDRGSQYVSIKYTERLAEAGRRAFGRQRRRQLRQCSRRDDQRPLQGRDHPSTRTVASFEAVEFATLEWVDWFNHRRLLGAHRQHSRRQKPKNATTPCWKNLPIAA